jgi:predicted PurR-regulated permease PerM
MAQRNQQDQHDESARRPHPTGFARRATIASAIFVAIVFVALFLWYSVYVLFLIFAGVLVAIFLRALADVVARHTRLSHRWSLAVVLVTLVALMVGLGFFAVPPLSKQAAALAETLPQAWQTLQAKVRETPIGGIVMGRRGGSEGAGGAGASTTQPASQPTSQPTPSAPPFMLGGESSAGSSVGQLLSRFGGFLSTVMDLFAAIIVIFFTGLFLAFDPTLYVRGAIRLVPPGYRVRFGEVIGGIGYTLKWWLIGQGITMTVIATATSIGLWLLGVPLAFVLGVIAGLFNFIPNFGPLFSMVPATLLALTISPERAIGVIVLFLVLQNLEGNVLTPLIQRKAVDLPPALGIIAQILLGILVGAVGLILAWPIAAAVVIAVKMMYVEDILGDEIDTPDDLNKKEVRDAKREAIKVEREEGRE